VGTVMKEKECGLGISLEGTVRVVGGREVQARHFIRAVAPAGPVAARGLHRVGDELLEVHADITFRLYYKPQVNHTFEINKTITITL
jgi:hypothetical protein